MSAEDIKKTEEQIMDEFALHAWNTFIVPSLEAETSVEELSGLVSQILEFFEDEMNERINAWAEYEGKTEPKPVIDGCECGGAITNPKHNVCYECWQKGKR